MVDLDKLEQRFINDEIRLFSRDISEGAKSREWFLKRLKNVIDNKIESGEQIPQLYSKQPFLTFGSYFKGTKVRDVDEFDVLVILDSNTGQFTQNGEIIGTGIGTCNPCNKYQKKYYKSDGSGVSPAKLLNWLKAMVTEIVDTFGGEAPERAGQAITATIKSKNLKIDLVPAGIFARTNDPDRIFYDIPNGNKDNGWILTAPHEDIDLIKNLASTRENFKNIIRILKSVKSDYNFDVSSFAIECSVVRYAQDNSWSASVATNMYNVLRDFASNLRNKVILDTWDNKTNLISHLAVNEWYADRIEQICDLMIELQKEYDEEKAYQKFRKKLRNEA